MKKLTFIASVMLVTWLVSGAHAASTCIRIDKALEIAKAVGRLKEPPVIIADKTLTGSYLIMIFIDGSAALAHFLPNDGCLVRSLIGSEAQARATIAAAKLGGA